MKNNLNDIIKSFTFNGEFIKADPFKRGHINDTYIASFKEDSGKIRRYTLQKINNNVFKDPEKLMENVMGITRHIREKIISAKGNPERETINMIPTIHNKYLYKNSDGEFWRAYSYIEDAQTYQVVENPNHFYSAGKAFGKFQKLLSDFPVNNLHETIPDFHNTPKRLNSFMNAVESDIMNRVREVKDEIKFVINRGSEMSLIVNLLETGELPLRVTHNDTKFNNVLIDNKTGEGICVIDLDTVMPGSSLYDFGDSIRSGANTADEDEPDLSKVWMDIGLFEHFTKGFLELTGEFMTPIELKHMPFSAKLISLELGMRFLSDYLDGDRYFKIDREHHNLDRARVQFKMAADMEAKYDQMCNIVEKYI